MNIILDFDGTCVAYKNPGIGEDIGAVSVLNELIDKGHKLILFTCRPYGYSLDEAVRWFTERKIQLYRVQSDPSQTTYSSSPKMQGDLIIDDLALGIPLKFDSRLSDRPFVDWIKVRKILIARDII